MKATSSFFKGLVALVMLGLGVSASAQSHYDYWPLPPYIMLKFEAGDVAFYDTLESINDVAQCNHVFSLSGPKGGLLAYGYSDLIVNATGDTLHVIAEEEAQTRCNAWGSVTMLPLVDNGDTLFYSLVYPRNREDILRDFYHKKIAIDEAGMFRADAPESWGKQITTHPSGGQTLGIRHGNGRDWWIVLLEFSEAPAYFRADQRWHVFLQTPDTLVDFGPTVNIPAPVSSNEASVSSQGDQIALTVGEAVLRFDFDRCTGSISPIDTIVADDYELTACAFSPDGKKLFVANRKRSLFVFDLTDPEYPRDTVFLGNGIFGFETMNLELGPDDRLYWGFEINTGLGAVDPTRYLMRVENPNADAADLVFDTFAVYLNGFQNFTNALPNFPNYELGPLVGSPCDTLFGDTVSTVTEPTPERAWTVTPTLSPEAFTIRGAKRPHQWEAYRMTGGLQAAGTGNRIAATPWPSGMYIVRLTDGTREQRVKVMVP